MKTDDQKELERFLFDFGRIVFGKDSGGLIAKLKNSRGVSGAWNVIRGAYGLSNPREYAAACLREKPAPKESTITDEKWAEIMERERARQKRIGWI